MKQEFKTFKYLSNQSGFGWNSATKSIEADDSVWSSLKEDYKRYKGKSFQFFEEMDLLFG